ncbi:hypothetical protein [Hyphomicrobium sp.]|uniref:hypothetical protein n=1 Tax=Hyphomicrobium sp. TaxID=82 RepID=UPI0025C33A75|nr:hypothetical protein [Hyphomicrobium sp.]MCC7251089.1 hypothetical protein [Hyphomicrobium sp.]
MPERTLASLARKALPRALATALLTAAGLAAACGQGLAQQGTGDSGTLPADPECLTVTQSSASTYMISNTACPDQSVLASIELAAGADVARCFVKKIRTQISLASEGVEPVVNYQCIEGAPGCSVGTVRDMFPECHSG